MQLLDGAAFVFALCLFLVIAIFAAANALWIGTRVRWPSKWQLGRFLSRARRLVALSPAAEFFYSSGLAFLAVGQALSRISAFSAAAAHACGATAIACGFVLDVRYRASAVWRCKAFRAGASVMLGLAGTGALFVSQVIGRQVAQSVTGLEARFVPDLVKLAAVISYPVAVVAVAAILLGFLALFEILVFSGASLVWQVAQWAQVAIPSQRARLRLRSLGSRLLYAKRLHPIPRYARRLGGFHLVIRPFAPLILLAAVAWPLAAGYRVAGEPLNRMLREAAVQIEFLPNGARCTLVPADALIAKMDGGQVAVAQRSAPGLVFATRRCGPS